VKWNKAKLKERSGLRREKKYKERARERERVGGRENSDWKRERETKFNRNPET